MYRPESEPIPVRPRFQVTLDRFSPVLTGLDRRCSGSDGWFERKYLVNY